VNFISRGIWTLTGGGKPSVHFANLRYRFVRIVNLRIHTPVTLRAIPDFDISTDTVEYQLGIETKPLTIKPFVQIKDFVLFHLSYVPVKGLSIPKISVITRIKKLAPKLAIQLADLSVRLNRYFAELLQKEISVNVRLVAFSNVDTLPALIIPRKVEVGRIHPSSIPKFFIRINPIPMDTVPKTEMALRRKDFTKALNIPLSAIEIIAVFRHVNTPDDCRIEYDVIKRCLKLYSSFDPDIQTGCHDVVVGRDRRSQQTHIAKYKSRYNEKKSN
jgi:hypothetical protein